MGADVLEQFDQLEKLCPHVHLPFPETPEGWWPIVEAMVRGIEVVAAQAGIQVYVLQIKEKYGTLRTHHATEYGDGDERLIKEALSVIQHLVELAEKRSEITCVRCGAPGAMLNYGGWISPYCAEHKPR